MPDDARLSTWTTYQAAWADVTSAERERLLRASIMEDCVYADPTGIYEGRTRLTDQIEQFRSSLPGAFFRNHAYVHHHGRSLAHWTLHDAAGNELQPGASVADYGSTGRITRVTGFFPLSSDAGRT